MRKVYILSMFLSTQFSIAVDYSVPFIGSQSPGISAFTYKDIGVFRELKEKIDMLKIIVKDVCFDPTDDNSDSIYFSTSTVYDIATLNQNYVTSWGCTASDGTDNDVVAGYVSFKDNLGAFDEAKVVLVGLDQTNVKIQTTSFDTNDRISSWCVTVLDGNTSDSVSVDGNMDIDGDGTNELTFQEFIKERKCS